MLLPCPITDPGPRREEEYDSLPGRVEGLRIGGHGGRDEIGRGAAGEVWKFEDGISKLAWECKELLSPTPQFFLINAYTADLSSITLGNLLSDVKGKDVEFGELGLKESSKGRILPAGIFARWHSV